MPKHKAEFVVKDVIVQVTCPTCRSPQQSPGWKDSTGWDAKDVRKVGPAGTVRCLHCGERFGLPAKLFQLVEGV